MTRNWNSNYHVNAVIDETQQYRYLFECRWGHGNDVVTFIMLNPSVGNVEQTDPTLVRCINYAKAWGYSGMNVVNLFAYISTDPKQLKNAIDPIGPKNDAYIRLATEQSDAVILAWGSILTTPQAKQRMQSTINLVRHKIPKCLKVTTHGNYPRHPLFLPRNLVPIPYTC